MIVPSIDLMNGHAVQLVGGEEKKIDAGDPRPLARRFGICGEVAVIDLDAARGEGSNAELIRELCTLAPCRVGGGIRDAATAASWLDAGARKVILGTAASPDILAELPRERVIAALDARDGTVVIEGWRTSTGIALEDKLSDLQSHVGGFLVTIVEREGRMTGVDLDRIEQIRSLAGDCKLTIAGGIRDAQEIGQLDAMGVDTQVGMALYSGRLTLADAIVSCLRTDRRDKLFPTVVADERGVALGLVYSNAISIHEAIETQSGVYWSRRKGIWRKGETSGATQTLRRIDVDCDRDALRFTVRQHGDGFCHLGTRTCWGDYRGLSKLVETIASRASNAPAGSYTRRLFEDASFLRSKLVEEMQEFIDAEQPAELIWEAADVLYFLLVALANGECTLTDVERELDRRALQLTRRSGDAKLMSDGPMKGDHGA